MFSSSTPIADSFLPVKDNKETNSVLEIVESLTTQLLILISPEGPTPEELNPSNILSAAVMELKTVAPTIGGDEFATLLTNSLQRDKPVIDEFGLPNDYLSATLRSGTRLTLMKHSFYLDMVAGLRKRDALIGETVF